jgi:hypothetical protein
LVRTYEATRPGADLAERLIAELEADDEMGEVPPYLFRERLERFLEPLVVPSADALGRLAGSAVREFIAKRHGKLGVPLEVRSMDERTVEQRYLFAPDWAIEPIEQLRKEVTTIGKPLLHGDRDRVHLLALQTALTRESIALPERKGS